MFKALAQANQQPAWNARLADHHTHGNRNVHELTNYEHPNLPLHDLNCCLCLAHPDSLYRVQSKLHKGQHSLLLPSAVLHARGLGFLVSPSSVKMASSSSSPNMLTKVIPT